MAVKESGKSGAELVNPYDSTRGKGEQVEEMFDNIAGSYDFMNTAMSLGLHRVWRDKALSAAMKTLGKEPAEVLDVATGTGDVAFRMMKLAPRAQITGIDLSAGMLAEARKKARALPEIESRRLVFGKADCLALPYRNGTFDLVTVAYGVRNFENLLGGLREMRRVMTRNGVLCIVELSVPEGALTGAAYRLYTKTLIPGIGKLVSGDRRAYSYLPESIAAAPQRDSMCRLLREAGFSRTEWHSLTFGAVTYYLARP